MSRRVVRHAAMIAELNGSLMNAWIGKRTSLEGERVKVGF